MTSTAVEPREQKSLPDLVAASKGELRRLLPDYDRFARVLTTELRRTPKLAECTPESFLASAFMCAQLDLEPGPIGDAWLIPRWNSSRKANECTLLIGYRGIEKLALRSGQILSIETRTVYEGDEFEVTYFPEQTVTHVPKFESGTPRLWYAVARRADGSLLVHVLDKDAVEARRKCSASPDRGPWKDHYDAMARKSVIRAMWQNLPLEIRDPAIDRALEVDEQAPDLAAIRPLDAGASDDQDDDIIDVEAEEEDDAPSPAAEDTASEAKDDPPPQADRPATDAQIKAIHTLAGKVGIIAGDDDGAYREELHARYEVGTSKDLTVQQAGHFIDWLQGQLEAGEGTS